jgi:twitching motility protein PilT
MARVDILLDSLLALGGTDLHVAPEAPPLVRVRGELTSVSETPAGRRDVESLLLELLTPMQAAELSERHELIFTYQLKTSRFRVRYGTVASGLEAVFRLLPAKILTLSELGLPEVLWRLSDRRSGLVIIAGPAGSGKSTTLSAMLEQVNRSRGCSIVTIEEPVEAIFEPNRSIFMQREIRRDAPDLATAIKQVATDDADLCAIYSLAGEDGIRAAVELAATELPVFACTNGGSVVSVVERIYASFSEADLPRARNLLSDVLAGIVVQRLVPTQDGRTRVLAHETLVLGGPSSRDVSAAIAEGKTEKLPTFMAAGQGQGMQTLDMALERLMSGGKITPEAALSTAFDKEAFSRIVARHRPDLAEPQVL